MVNIVFSPNIDIHYSNDKSLRYLIEPLEDYAGQAQVIIKFPHLIFEVHAYSNRCKSYVNGCPEIYTVL